MLRLDDEDQRLAVKLAQVAVKQARRQVTRFKKLAPSGTVAQTRLDTATAELESAELHLSQAKSTLKDRAVFAPFDGETYVQTPPVSDVDPVDAQSAAHDVTIDGATCLSYTPAGKTGSGPM